MRPIDADAALDNLPDDLPYKGSVKRVLMQAPTADVVEVVRCGDCKQCESYYPSKKEGEEPYPLLYECKRERKCVFPTDFCSYGERREV